MWVILGFCVVAALVVGVLRARAPKTLRGRYRDFEEKVREDRAKGPYLSTHPRPEWDGSKSGER